ncbi:MAG: ABC transporter substrate-binding protein [Bryobacteraceae bacterium]|nr:ABC transporter substrate-binding protein [Bryobacteraceae bacterium]
MNKRLVLLLAALASALGAADSGGQLRFAIQAEPRTFDPHLVNEDASGMVRFLTAGVLIRLNRQTQKPEPELAQSWKVGQGGRTITLQLRENITFSNGSPFTAEDAVFSIQRVSDPKNLSPVGDSLRAGGQPPQAKVTGKYSLSVRFAAAVPNCERLFDDLAMVSALAPADPRVALGPFLVKEYKAGSHLLLERNPRYWKKDAQGKALPYLASIRVEIQRNRDMEMLKFRRGELHLIQNLDPDGFSRLQNAGAEDLGVSLNLEMVWFNQAPQAALPAYKKAWFQSREFRQAVSEAVNRDDIARIVFKGHATPAPGPVSPGNQFWSLKSLPPPFRSPQAALARLRKAGFSLRGGQLYDPTGQPVEFSIITNAGNKSRERMASLVRQDLGALGMRVNVVTLDFPSLIERISKTGQYEACLLGFVYNDLDPNSQMNIWLSSSGTHPWNPGQKKPATPWEAEIDRLIVAQAAEPDPIKRKATFDRVQQIVVDQAAVTCLVYKNALLAVQPGVKNVKPVVLPPNALWNVERLYLEGDALRASR